MCCKIGEYIFAVPSDLSLLAFGIPPAREAELAGGMPKVPKGQGLGRLARWAFYILPRISAFFVSYSLASISPASSIFFSLPSTAIGSSATGAAFCCIGIPIGD